MPLYPAHSPKWYGLRNLDIHHHHRSAKEIQTVWTNTEPTVALYDVIAFLTKFIQAAGPDDRPWIVPERILPHAITKKPTPSAYQDDPRNGLGRWMTTTSAVIDNVIREGNPFHLPKCQPGRCNCSEAYTC